MKILAPFRIGVCLLILSAGLISAGLAQTTPTTPTDTVPSITTGLAHENVGSLGDRSPGNMVRAGVQRSQEAVNLPRSQTTITQEPEVGFRELFVAGATEILLEQFENLLFYFTNLLLERAGLPAIDPDDLPNGNDNDNDNDNGNDNDNDNDNGNDNDNDNDNDNGNNNDNDNGNNNANLNGNDNTAGGTDAGGIIGGGNNDNTTGTGGRPGGVRGKSR